jgi:hypothetical protein
MWAMCAVRGGVRMPVVCVCRGTRGRQLHDRTRRASTRHGGPWHASDAPPACHHSPRFHPQPCALAPTQAIIREQAAQRELKLTMAQAEKDDDDAYDAYAESARKMGQYTDAEVQAARAEMRKRVMEENLKLAASQSASKSFLTTQVYKNSVDPSFFDNFGQTSR